MRNMFLVAKQVSKLGENGDFFMSFGIQKIIQGPPVLNSCMQTVTFSSRSSTNNFQEIRHNLFITHKQALLLSLR